MVGVRGRVVVDALAIGVSARKRRAVPISHVRTVQRRALPVSIQRPQKRNRGSVKLFQTVVMALLETLWDRMEFRLC
jgi:hypothetical protein